MKRDLDRSSDGVIALRLIDERDLPTTLEWRNRDDARVWFKTQDKIAPDAHRAWFERYRGKDDDYLFVVEVDGRAVGQCAVYGIDHTDGSAEVGRFLAAPGESGRGYMRRSCALLTRLAADALGLRYLFLEVLENNARAIKVYAACGFVEEQRGGGLVRMGLRLADTGMAAGGTRSSVAGR